MKFEEVCWKAAGRKWVKACIKEKRDVMVRTKNTLERVDYLKRNGYSQEAINQLEQKDRTIHVILETRDKETQAQWQYNQ